MRNKIGNGLMLLGAALVLAALSLFCWNRYEDYSAGRAAESLTAQIIEAIPTATQTHGAPESSDADGTDEAEGRETRPAESASGDDPVSTDPVSPAQTVQPGTAMPVVRIDGHDYIGYLSIPSLGLELGVMSEWSYANLKLSPCRYSGSAAEDNLVICGHNYRRHFGTLGQISVGDTVLFTDMEGESIPYEVITVETLEPTAIGEMTAGEYDLTLFTCTYGGTARTAVRCDRAS